MCRVLWVLRVACFVYAVSLCCTHCASSLEDSGLTWLWVAVVQTLSDGMSQVMLCCSYIVINACVTSRRLLQANACAQAVVAALHSALPLCVQKVTELAEAPESYNSATYFLLFTIGAVASVLSMFGTLFVSGEELEASSAVSVVEIELKEMPRNAKAGKKELGVGSSCNNSKSVNENNTN